MAIVDELRRATVQRHRSYRDQGWLLRMTASFSAYETSTEPTISRSRVGEQNPMRKFSNSQAARKLVIQTGLADSQAPIEKNAGISGSRFEYRNECVDGLGKRKTYSELEIQTIYENKNEGSHFNPLRGFIQNLRDFNSPSHQSSPFSRLHLRLQIFIDVPLVTANVVARMISAGFNFFVNKKFVFASDKPFLKELGGYILLANFSLT